MLFNFPLYIGIYFFVRYRNKPSTSSGTSSTVSQRVDDAARRMLYFPIAYMITGMADSFTDLAVA